MLARHAASASTRAPRVAPEPRLVACRRASTPARCASGGWSGPRRPPRAAATAPSPPRRGARASARGRTTRGGPSPCTARSPARRCASTRGTSARWRRSGPRAWRSTTRWSMTIQRSASPGAARARSCVGDAARRGPPREHRGAVGGGGCRFVRRVRQRRRRRRRFRRLERARRRRGRGDGSIRRPPRRRGLASRRRLAFGSEFGSASGARPVLGGHADRKRRRHHAPRASRAPLGGRGAGGGHAAHRASARALRIRKRLVSYHAHNERARRDHLVARIAGGAALALVSDAGTPAVSDPGADLVKACADACLSVVPIPGPCAPAAAIVAAGALTEGNEPGFSFIGFLPPKASARRTRWRKFSNAPGSVVAFVPPHKLVATLQDAAAELGEGRACVVCREMTKVRNARREPFFGFFWFFLVFFGDARFTSRRQAVIIPLTKLLLPSVSFRPSPHVEATPGAVTTQITTKV